MEYTADTRKFFAKQVPAMLSLMERIAGALEQRTAVKIIMPVPPDQDELLHRLYRGCWESAGEMQKSTTTEYALIGKRLLEQENALRAVLTEDQWAAVQEYGNTVMQQASESMEQAFVAGAKLAMSLVICGLPATGTPVATLEGEATHDA